MPQFAAQAEKATTTSQKAIKHLRPTEHAEKPA